MHTTNSFLSFITSKRSFKVSSGKHGEVFEGGAEFEGRIESYNEWFGKNPWGY